MTMQSDERSIWVKIGPLAVAIFISLSVLAFVSVSILNGISERLIRQQAERDGIAWAAHIGSSLERIAEIARGEETTWDERAFLINVRQFGDIFKYKIFDPDGHLRFNSGIYDGEDADGKDLGEHNPVAASVLAGNVVYAELHDGSETPNRPDVYAEAYVPIFRNGKVVAISEVYVDETNAAAMIREDFALFGVIIAGLTLLVLLVPLWALRLLTQELQQRNFDLNVERARAVDAENAKSAFLAHMSHELRTPLNAIQGLSEMMIRGDLGQLEHPKYLEYSKDINFSAAHLLKLVNDILDLSKIDAGKFELEESDVDLGNVIGDALRIARAWSSTSRVSLKAEAATGTLIARADERAIKQILLNLLSNAAKFTPAGGEIHIAAKLDDSGNGVITVTDTGDGIASADLGSIIEPFNQLRRPAGLQQEGTGLGLSLVKSMIELHGGTLDIQSFVGLGTTVTVTIPAERMRIPAAPK